MFDGLFYHWDSEMCFLLFLSQFILDLCQFDSTADFDLVQPHLDRMQEFTEAWVTEVSLRCYSNFKKNIILWEMIFF